MIILYPNNCERLHGTILYIMAMYTDVSWSMTTYWSLNRYRLIILLKQTH